ncbi:MAG: methylmalonyl-CoA mutase family protein, partial [Thermomicrobium sp.]|nr:methylmalonyl-CoA mutase family protein [Thermomicrobium sp.]
EYRARQDAGRVARALDRVETAARGTENMLPVLREALLAGATLGQICGRLRQVWGEYRPRF